MSSRRIISDRTQVLDTAPFYLLLSIEDTMTKPKSQPNRGFGTADQQGKLTAVNSNATGIDIGATSRW